MNKKREIARLKEEVVNRELQLCESEKENERLKSVIAMTEEHFQPSCPFENEFDDEIKKAKQEAIKEFAEALKSEMGEHWDTDNPRIYEIIDDLLKEWL